jgi:hypothetical protein
MNPATPGSETWETERLAALVHQAYLDTCARLGWEVSPSNQVPYAELSEDAKELDRASVRAVLAEHALAQREARYEAALRVIERAKWYRDTPRGETVQAIARAALEGERT